MESAGNCVCKGSSSATCSPTIEGKQIVIFGIFPRIARLRSEHHQYVDDPAKCLALPGSLADIFTFLPPVAALGDPRPYPALVEKIALLSFDTYEKWWTRQINDKTRNMVRRAGKKGVTIRQVDFCDELAKGIQAIYNESPLLQGKPSKHYGKDFETIKKAHATFLDQSIFLGAFFENNLVGFIKLIVHPNGASASIMQIISMVSHRDKSPTNALLAKAVELCAERGIKHLQYGIWSRRSLGEFKKHHGFIQMDLPRYFVPLNWRGRLALALGLHRSAAELVPGNWQDVYANARAKYYLRRYKSRLQTQAA